MKELSTTNNSVVFKDEEITTGDIITYGYDGSVYKVISIKDDNTIIMEDNYGNTQELSSYDFQYYKLIKGVSFEDVDSVSDQIIKGEISFESLRPVDNQENALMVVNTDLYVQKRDQLNAQLTKVEAIKNMVKHKTELMRRNIEGVVTKFNTIISELNKIIFTLELYAGISETIKQIQAGQPAPDTEPIHLMQLMKFMDEEVGDPSNGGISYDTIEQFNEWLLSYNKHLGYHNYHLLIPFEKGVRIMRVRRTASERYLNDIFGNSWNIQMEMRTYVIIRNGTNFYTIDSKMQFSDKLYPDTKELTDFFDKGGDFMEDAKMQHYKHGMILMQGLVDRTDVFGNAMGKISFLKPDSAEKGDVVFNYENDDKLITDGSLSSLDFLNTSTIQAGDRVLVYNPSLGYNAKRLYKIYFRSEWDYPPAPDTGIYKLEYDKEYKTLFFRYNPKDNVWNPEKGSHERKRGFSYRIYPNDGFIVNIDIVSHRNIQWIENMLYDRRDRRNYLRAVGLFQTLQKVKREELKQEDPFKSMVMSVCKTDELTALDAIHWWKTKNKHKRPLFIDDTKALRMISKYIKSNKKDEKEIC